MSIAKRAIAPVAVGAILASTLAVGLPVASRAVEPTSNWGMATIDGTLDPGEWRGGPFASFSAALPPHDGGGFTGVVAWAMNDGGHLYLALSVGRPDGHLALAVDVDDDNDGVAEVGEDHLLVEVPSGQIANAEDRHQTTCPGDPAGSALCSAADDSAGGSDDIEAAAGSTEAGTIIELGVPLASGDDLDAALGPEDVVGLQLVLTLDSISPLCAGDTCTTRVIAPASGFSLIGVAPLLQTNLSTIPSRAALLWTPGPVEVALNAEYHGPLTDEVSMTYSTVGAQPIAETSLVTRQRTFSVSTDGITTVVYRSSVAGYTEPEKLATLLVDSTPPVAGFVRLGGGAAATNVLPILLEWSGSDAVSGLQPVSFEVAGGIWVGFRVTNVDQAAGRADVSLRPSPTEPPPMTTTASVHVKWIDYAGNTAELSDSILFDNAAPSGSIAIDGGADVTGDRAVVVSVPATDGVGGIGVTQMRIATEAGETAGTVPPTAWETMAYRPTLAITLPSQGARAAVWVSWGDALGNWSTWTSDTISVEQAPRIVSFGPRPVRFATSFAPNRPTVRVAWQSSQAAAFTVQRSTDGGAYRTVATGIATTRLDESLHPGHRYRYRVRGTVAAGWTSAWATLPAVSVLGHQESSGSIRYRGNWTTVADDDAWGDMLRRTRSRGASASLSFTGRSVAWVARRGPTSGRAQIYIDGRLVKTIDLRSATRIDREVVYQRTWSAVGSHTIRIVNLGTSGRPRIDLDGFGVVR